MLRPPPLLIAAALAVSCGPAGSADRRPRDERSTDGEGRCAVAVVRGRVVDARGRGAIVQVRYSGALDGRLHFTDNSGYFTHRLVNDGSGGPGTQLTVMPLYAGVGETTMVSVPGPRWRAGDCEAEGREPPDTVALQVQLPPVRGLDRRTEGKP